ncbi:MAG TPA: AAA family ATPase [Candidatus Saccharimonadales bacterium]|nr:AAA family ATPase [Candidatus Saccharimonadales bacterium]
MDTLSHTLILPWVESATGHFVYADEMRKAFSLAIAAGVNLIFSGPGGHGKSEFLEAAFGAIRDVTPYVKSFGQGTSPEELYGGLDLDALNRQGGAEKAVLQYSPELSFLACRVAVFEELFDAPPRVLTSLKDTLTARELRNGHQRYPMVTRIIAAPTNHSPQEVAEGQTWHVQARAAHPGLAFTFTFSS